MMLMKCENFCKAAARLWEELEEYAALTGSTVVRDGVIQRFELTFELAWKSLKEYMEDQGAEKMQFPKQVLKKAYAAGLISDEEVWLDMLASRNVTSHIYDDAQAARILTAIRDRYRQPFDRLADFYQEQS